MIDQSNKLIATIINCITTVNIKEQREIVKNTQVSVIAQVIWQTLTA